MLHGMQWSDGVQVKMHLKAYSTWMCKKHKISLCFSCLSDKIVAAHVDYKGPAICQGYDTYNGKTKNRGKENQRRQ